MPLLPAIFAALASWIGPLAVRVLTGLGFAAVSYVGIEAVFSSISTAIHAQYSGFGEISGLVGLSGVDDAVEIVLGAWTARIGIVLATKSLRIAAAPAA